MANQNRTMSVSYRWTEDAKELRQVTHKWKFSHPFPLPNFGRSFIVANISLISRPSTDECRALDKVDHYGIFGSPY